MGIDILYGHAVYSLLLGNHADSRRWTVLLEATQIAYRFLLRLTPAQRMHCQDHLCIMRDAIASATHEDSATVQTQYESERGYA